MKTAFALVLCLVLLAGAPAGRGAVTLMDFEGDAGAGLRTRESAAGSVRFDLKRDDERGGFLELTFTRGPKAGFAYVYLPVTRKLAGAAAGYDGLTFKVRGDGSGTFGLIEIRSDDYVNIFQAVFRLNSTEWSDVAIRWEEFFQLNERARQARIDWNALNVFALGSRAMWGTCRYAIDEVALAKIPLREPVRARDGAARLARTARKLRAGEELTLVALGDSITFGTKVPPEARASALYFAIVAAGLQEAFPGAKVKTVNAGVGGDIVAEGLLRVGHQVAVRNPDLVLVLLGANDALYEFAHERVRHTMSLLLDRLIETTQADILLLGPTQITGKPGIPEGYGKIYEALAREKGVAYLDLSAALAALAKDDYKRALADNVHLSRYGHEVAGKAVLQHILETVK